MYNYYDIRKSIEQNDLSQLEKIFVAVEVQYLDNITKKNYLCTRSGEGENFEF